MDEPHKFDLECLITCLCRTCVHRLVAHDKYPCNMCSEMELCYHTIDMVAVESLIACLEDKCLGL
jgi:hypothetical protein